MSATRPTALDGYLREPIDYGGETVPRGAMLADLERLAAALFPGDPARQRAQIEAYLKGRGGA